MRIVLEYASPTPLYLQLRNAIVLGIGRGDLKHAEALPTIRQLAEDAGINMMTVNKAYQLLQREGYIMIDRRRGARVSSAPPKGPDPQRLQEELELVIVEAGLGGMPRVEFLQLCDRLYRKLEEAMGRRETQ